MENNAPALADVLAIEETDPNLPAAEVPWSVEKYLVERAGDLGIYLAVGFFLLRWLSATGLITEWRRGQQALAKLSDSLDALSNKLDKQAERTRDQIDGLERSVDSLKDRVDRLSDKIDRK